MRPERKTDVDVVEAEGRTVLAAIAKGLAALGATRNQVTIRVLAEERQGLFGMRGAKPARVRVAFKKKSPKGSDR